MTERRRPGRRLRDGWMEIAARFGEAQTLVLLGAIYLLAIGPAALVARVLGADFLSRRSLGEPGSAWREPDSRPPALENVEQPF